MTAQSYFDKYFQVGGLFSRQVVRTLRHFYETKRINCRGKIEHKFLADAGFIHNVAPMTAAMLTKKTEDMPCTKNSVIFMILNNCVGFWFLKARNLVGVYPYFRGNHLVDYAV
jgi:hypothetical protein